MLSSDLFPPTFGMEIHEGSLLNLANFLANLAVVSFRPGTRHTTSTVFKVQSDMEKPLSTFIGVERSITRAAEYTHAPSPSMPISLSKRVGIYSYAITNHHGPGDRSGNRKQIAFASFLPIVRIRIRVGLFPGGVVL